METEEWKEIELKAEQMLRFECVKTTRLKLIKGSAELFGSELSFKMNLQLQEGYRGTVLTFHGCTLKLSLDTAIDYIISFSDDQDLPNIYVNLHSALENIRQNSINDERGPRILICGNRSVGKTTVCRTLSNYAARKYRKIVFIDANVELNDLSIPGTISALIVKKPYEISEGWDVFEDPVVFSFGHTKPTDNLPLFKKQLDVLAEIVSVRAENDPELFAGGCIINMSGIDKADYTVDKKDSMQAVKAVIQAFEINILVVIEDGFLETLLKQDLPEYVTAIRIPKSSGAHSRTDEQWEIARATSVHSYFHGKGSYQFQAYKVNFNLTEYKLYKISYKKVDSSLLPMSDDDSNSNSNSNSGEKSSSKDSMDPVISDDIDWNSLVTDITSSVTKQQLINRILAISETTDPDELVSSSVVGFLAVNSFDNDTKEVEVLSPCSNKPNPDSILLYTGIEYIDV